MHILWPYTGWVCIFLRTFAEEKLGYAVVYLVLDRCSNFSFGHSILLALIKELDLFLHYRLFWISAVEFRDVLATRITEISFG